MLLQEVPFPILLYSIHYIDNTKDSNIAIYVACHYDYSQLEYVGPFLERFAGAKVFIYKWNGLYEEMKKHYSSSEYEAYLTKVYDFSLQAIVNCLVEDALNGRRVVFLMTAGMSYSFGKYQKRLFQLVKVHIIFLLNVFLYIE